MMEALGAIQERLRGHDGRLDGIERSLEGVVLAQGKRATEIAVMQREVSDIHDDIKGLVAQVAWVQRGLWAAAATFLIFVIALAGLISQVAGGG